MSGAPPLVGREPVLASLRTALGAAVNGHGTFVLLTGEAGIGKTALAAHLADEAARAGVPVAWGRCADGDGVPAYWPWTQVLRATGGLASDIDHLGDGAQPLDAGSALGAQDRFRLFDRVIGHLDLSARDHGIVVVLDDLHWADADSLALLDFGARQLAGRRVLLVGTYRDVEAGESLRRVAGNAHMMRLGGLDADGTGRLMAGVAGEAISEEVAARMQARTGGNPLFVRELTRLLGTRRAPEGPWPSAAAVDSVRDTVDRRLARLSQPCIQALTLAALDGAVLRPWLLRRVLGEGLDLAALVDEAIQARILLPDDRSQVRFAHDVFREVLVAGIPASARRRAHEDLAHALDLARAAGIVVHPAELAGHFAAAAMAGDSAACERAVLWAREAAADASARLAFEDAVVHLERALAVVDAAPSYWDERPALLLAMADARRLAGHLGAAATTYREVLSGARRVGDPEPAARAAIGLHAVGLKTGPSAERDEHAAMLAEAGNALGDDFPALTARVRAALARTLHHSLDAVQMAKAPAVAVDAVALARRSGDVPALLDSLLAAHDAAWRPGAARQRLVILDEMRAVASDVHADDRGTTERLLRAEALLELGDPAALTEVDGYSSAAERLGDPRSRWAALSRRAALALLAGRVDDAAELMDRAGELAEQTGDADAIWIGDIQRWELARFDGGRGEYRRRRPDRDPPVEAWPPWRAIVLADGGDLDAAAAVLAGFTAGQAWGPGVTAGYDLAFPAIAAEAAARCGTDALRNGLYDLFLPFTGTQVGCGAWVAYCGAADYYLGLLAEALGQPTAAAHFDAATAQHLRLQAPRWAALSSRPRATGAVAPNRFRQSGAVWSVTFEGVTAHVADAKGLQDIAVLLGQPDRPVPAITLAGVGAADRGQPVLDRQALAAYRARPRDLDDDIVEADADHDLDRATNARLERDSFVDQLSRAVGLGGRPRRLGDETEKARKTVTARIRRALDQLDDSHAPLAVHLRQAVRTGTTCAYEPPEPVAWEL